VQKHIGEKLNIILKTWNKMSEGHQHAFLKLPTH
jgi:hypothetical protein